MSDTQAISIELGRAIGHAIMRCREMTPEEIISTLDAIESSFLPKVESDPDLQLETQRRIAEQKFYLLGDRDLPYGTVSQLRDQIRLLGFTNLDIQTSVEVSFARYCIRQGRRTEALEVLRSLCADIDRALQAQDLAFYRHLKRCAEKALKEVAPPLEQKRKGATRVTGSD